MTGYSYSDEFMRYTARSSAYSATAITSILRDLISVESVLDVGCAKGTWLRAWKKLGVADVYGVDGSYIDQQTLEIPISNFIAADVNAAFDLGRQFDLVQSLEVGEHIDESASDVFVDSLARHARCYILFSAAPPGQGGEHHINEQPYEFWRRKFEGRGFATVDAIRPFIIQDSKISYWYRYNIFLFIRRELLREIAENLTYAVVPATDPVKDLSSLLFRLRKALVRRLPYVLQQNIARLKSKLLRVGRI